MSPAYFFRGSPVPPPPPPPARSLEAVLKASRTAGRVSATTGTTVVGIELLIGSYAQPFTGSTATRYGNVYLPGSTQPTAIPKIKGTQDGAVGQPAYVLSTPGRMLLLGTVA